MESRNEREPSYRASHGAPGTVPPARQPPCARCCVRSHGEIAGLRSPSLPAHIHARFIDGESRANDYSGRASLGRSVKMTVPREKSRRQRTTGAYVWPFAIRSHVSCVAHGVSPPDARQAIEHPPGRSFPLLSSQGAPGAAPGFPGVLLGALLLHEDTTHTSVCVQRGPSLILRVEINISLTCVDVVLKNLETFP